MAKEFNRQKGGVGEQIAARLLQQKGYQLVEMNARTKFGELDVICVDNDVLVFVEVKLKVGEDYGTPEEMIDTRKLRQVRRTAELYTLANSRNIHHDQYRIDAVCIVIDREGNVLRSDHYENIDM